MWRKLQALDLFIQVSLGSQGFLCMLLLITLLIYCCAALSLCIQCSGGCCCRQRCFQGVLCWRLL
jgi:hypothetical protein